MAKTGGNRGGGRGKGGRRAGRRAGSSRDSSSADHFHPADSADLVSGGPRAGVDDDLSLVVPLYEDNHLLVLAKPAGIPMQSGSGNNTSLLGLGKHWLKQKYDKPGNVFLGLVHRLDRVVSGVVVLGKTSKAASRLSEQFRIRTVEKVYRALVPKPAPSGTWKHYITDLGDGRVGISDESVPGSKVAVLEYEVERDFGDLALVRIALETGRKHQIRLQFSHEGSPIVGDFKYGSSETFFPNAIALESFLLEFDHPVRPERLLVELPPEISLIERYCAELI